jgi:O-antigen ligase
VVVKSRSRLPAPLRGAPAPVHGGRWGGAQRALSAKELPERRPDVLRVLAMGVLAASFLDGFAVTDVPFARTLAGIIGMLLLGAFVLVRVHHRRFLDLPGRFIFVFIVLTSVLEVARIGGPNEGVLTYMQFFQVAVLYLIVFDLALDPRAVRAMGGAFLLSTTAMSLVSHLGIDALSVGAEGQRSGVSGLNLNDQAFLYALCIVIVVGWVLSQWPRFGVREVFLGAAAMSMLLALVRTASRGGAAAMLVGVATCLMIHLRRGKLSAYVTVVPALLLGIGVALLSAEVLQARTEKMIEVGDTGLRVELAHAGFGMFVKRPVFGWGVRYSRDLGESLRLGRAIAAHNTFLQFLLSFGLVGFLPWAVAVTMTVVLAWRCRGSPWGAILAALLVTALATACVQNLGYSKHFWIVLGIAARGRTLAAMPLNVVWRKRSVASRRRVVAVGPAPGAAARQAGGPVTGAAQPRLRRERDGGRPVSRR